MGPSLVQRPARSIASSMRRWPPVSRTSTPRAASLPIHASASRATRARISAALRWPASSAADQRLEVLVELAPRAVGPDVARKIGERLELDPMRDRDRATRTRQQDEQAPRAHPGVSEDVPGDRIDLAEIVEQPAVGAERAELPCERGEVETVEERHQPCRGSGGAARHSHTSPPVARQETWSIAPSKPTRRRSSSVNPAPYSAQAAPSGVACTASASPTR